MNIAIILAGGSGTRIKSEIPKQFLKINGKRIIEYSLQVFEQHPFIDEIAVVIPVFYIKETKSIVAHKGYKKVQKVIAGGMERYHSCWEAIQMYENYPQANVLIHDAARPWVDANTISEVLDALNTYNAVSVAIPATDTIYYMDNHFIQQIPNRKYTMRAQTPQGFKQYLLQNAYKQAIQEKTLEATDDCGVVLKYFPNEPIFVVQGSERNIKITHQEDILLFKTSVGGHNPNVVVRSNVF